MGRRGTVWVVAGAVVVAQVVMAGVFLGDVSPGNDAAWRGFPLDDAWIHLVYARSVATHGVPSYVDGALEAGFTSPLWMLLLAVVELLGRAGAPVVALTKGLGVACAAAASLGVLALARRLGASLGAAAVAALLLSASPTFGFAQVSGMEVALAGAAAVWALERAAAGADRAAGWLLAAAALARPEMAVLVAVVVAAGIRWESVAPGGAGEGRGRRLRGPAWSLVLPPLLAGVLWSAYCLAVTGHPLPNTFYVKAGGGGLGGVWNVLSGVVLDMPLFASVTGAVLWLLGAAVLLGGSGEAIAGPAGATGAQRRRSVGAAVLLVPLLFDVGVGLSRSMPPYTGAFFYWLRWALPVEPLWLVPAALGVTALWSGVGLRLHVLAPVIRRVAAVALVLGVVLASPGRVATRVEQYAWNCSNIEEVQVAMGRWVAANVAPSETVMVNDAGAIRYFGGRRTVDLIGLNSHEVLFDIPRALRQAARRNTKAMLDLMGTVHGDVLIVFPLWAPPLFRSASFQAIFQPVQVLRSEHYTVVPARQDIMVALRPIPPWSTEP